MELEPEFPELLPVLGPDQSIVNPAVPPEIFTSPIPSFPPIVEVGLCSVHVKTKAGGSINVTEVVAVQLTLSVKVIL
jgi:hypothetical protein